MYSVARGAALAAALALLGCGQSSEGGSQMNDVRLGFVGATATPTQMTMSPAGCAASYLFDSMTANLRGEWVTHPGPGGVYVPGVTPVTEGPPRPGSGRAVGVFTAPPSIVGKPISITVRGFIAGAGGATRMSFAGQQSETWTDSATASEPLSEVVHTFVAPAVAGENRFELDIALPLEGNEPSSASLTIDTVDFRVGDVEGCDPDIARYEQEQRPAD